MSRSNPTENLSNPCKHWFQWSGDGFFTEYDKEAKKNIEQKMPFKFVVIDSLVTITGYNEPQATGYWSNEVRNSKDLMTVRSKHGVEMTGTYEQIKEKMAKDGASYCQSVYIMFYNGKTPTLGNIKMKGASLGAWFEFCKENKVMEIGVQVKESKTGKKGKVTYEVPIFEPMAVSEATNAAAIEIDKELQEYLTAYLQKNASEIPADKAEPKEEVKAEVKAETKSETKSQSRSESQEEGSAPVFGGDDDDLPF